jgi:hypothetical protein
MSLPNGRVRFGGKGTIFQTTQFHKNHPSNPLETSPKYIPEDRPIEHLLSKLTDVQPRGRGYTATCPLHPSKPAVLTIKKEFGQVLFDCPSGCSDNDIVKAIGLALVDLMEFDEEDDLDPDLDPDLDDDDDEEEEDGQAPNESLLPDEMLPAGKDRPMPPEFYYYSPIRRNGFDVGFLDDCVADDDEEPESRDLFGDFWAEDELSILFAGTGHGKSILAVQIADSLSRGVPIDPFELTVPAQKVLYFDFEMSRKNIRKRYSYREPETREITGRHCFSRNLIRANLSQDREFSACYDTYEDYLHESVEELFRDSGARIVILDNLTFLNRSANTSGTKAFRLMDELQRLKGEYGLSILAIAHTPKRRHGQPITIDDLHGSKMLANAADNVFAIGASGTGDDIRYIKHLKPRNGELRFGASNVCVFRILKRDNFLGFHFIGHSTEREHLLPQGSLLHQSRASLKKKVKELHEAGHTQREIAVLLDISVATVNRYLKKSDYL